MSDRITTLLLIKTQNHLPLVITGWKFSLFELILPYGSCNMCCLLELRVLFVVCLCSILPFVIKKKKFISPQVEHKMKDMN